MTRLITGNKVMNKNYLVIIVVLLLFVAGCSSGDYKKGKNAREFVQFSPTDDELYKIYLLTYEGKDFVQEGRPIPKHHFMHLWNSGDQCFIGREEVTICNYKPERAVAGFHEVKITL